MKKLEIVKLQWNSRSLCCSDAKKGLSLIHKELNIIEVKLSEPDIRRNFKKIHKYLVEVMGNKYLDADRIAGWMADRFVFDILEDEIGYKVENKGDEFLFVGHLTRKSEESLDLLIKVLRKNGVIK